MTRPSIFSTPFSRMLVNKEQLYTYVEYLIRHPDIIMSAATAQSLMKTSSRVTTPVSRLYNKAYSVAATEEFCLFSLKAGIHTIPEVLTMRQMTFDTQQMAVVSDHLTQALSQSAMAGKILLNTTQLIRDTGFSDLEGFQRLVVRDLLSRSFFTDTKTMWLTPQITQYVCKVYSMSLGSFVAQLYNLDLKTQQIITLLFAYFFMSQMSNGEGAKQMLTNRWNWFQTPDPRGSAQIFDLIQDQLGKPSLDSLDDVLAMIGALGIDRIQLDLRVLLNKTKNWGPDIHTSGIALEYPPYFLYMILLGLSGAKIGLMLKMKGLRLVQDGTDMVNELAQTHAFLTP